jgi:hypothetical protein
MKTRVDVGLRDSGVAQQLTHDLRIGLSVEAVLARSGLAEVLLQRLKHGAAAGAVGPQDRAVDVEQHDLLAPAGVRRATGRAID